MFLKIVVKYIILVIKKRTIYNLGFNAVAQIALINDRPLINI